MNCMHAGLRPAYDPDKRIRFGDMIHAVLPYVQMHGSQLPHGTKWLREYLIQQGAPPHFNLLAVDWLYRILIAWDYVADLLNACERVYLEPLFLGRYSSDLMVYHDSRHAYVIELKTRHLESPEKYRMVSLEKSYQQVRGNTRKLRKLDPHAHIYGYVLWMEYSTKDSQFVMTPVWELVVDDPAPL